jgi:hypothetical protein
MIVNRNPDPKADLRPELTVYFKNPGAVPPEGVQLHKGDRHQPDSSATAQSTAQPPDWDERVVKMDLTHKTDEAILLEVMTETGATAVMPTAEDQADMDRLQKLEEEGKVASEAMKERVRGAILKRKQEKKAARRAAKAAGVGQPTTTGAPNRGTDIKTPA